MHNIQIIENVINQTLFDILLEKIVSPQIPWFYGNTTYKTGHENSLWGSSFEHLIIENGNKNSPLYETFEPILKSILIDQGVKLNQFLRARLGMITVTPELLIHKPHVDYNFDHKVGLIYFSNTNAPTYFYNKKYDSLNELSILDYYESEKDNFIIEKEVECKANTLVLFDGDIYHSSSTPTNTDRRIVLSFNYV
jgi:hypothetical protein